MTIIADVALESYPTDVDEVVRARAVIEHGQAGAWAMFVNRSHVAGGAHQDWVELGTGQSLIGKILEVSAVMKDVKDNTNRLGLRVDVAGASAVSAALDHAGGSGDSAAYSIIIKFERVA
jgi:hypothetical protein